MPYWAGKIKGLPLDLMSLSDNVTYDVDLSGDAYPTVDGTHYTGAFLPESVTVAKYGTQCLQWASISIEGQKVFTLSNGKYAVVEWLNTEIEYYTLTFTDDIDNYVFDDASTYVYRMSMLIGGGGAVDGLDYRFGVYVDEEHQIAIPNVLYQWSGDNTYRWNYGGSPYTTRADGQKFYEFFVGAISESDDPYDDGSGDGGGSGSDDGNDDIDFPGLPDLDAVDTGFVNIYSPTVPQLKALATYMWSTDFFDNIVKLWADPMDVILGLSIVPVSVPTVGARDVKCGNVSTGVSMNLADRQYMTVDCGSLKVNEFYGSYLDYSPYTKLSVFLPFCGTHAIDTDECMGKTLHIKYNVDILSGSCVAFIKCGGSVMYSFTGNITSNIPVTGENFSRLIQTAVGSAASLGATALSGGAAAPVVTGLVSSANAIAGSKPNMEKSGSVSSTTGLLGIKTPYLIRERPRACVPASQNKYMGYPSFSTKTLSALNGYTEVEKIHLEGLSCTQDEQKEIEQLLMEGVIL